VRKRSSQVVGSVVVLVCALLAYMVCLHPVWMGIEAVRLSLWRHGVRSEWTTVDGERIHYFEAMPKGQAKATPVLMVHGLGGRGEDWVTFMPELAAQGFHVYAPDLLGYGQSAQPADASYSIAQETEFVEHFMADRGIQSANVVGWSMGGWITLKLALDQPQLVKSVTLIDSAGLYFHPPMSLALFDPQTEDEVQQLFHYLEPNDRRLPHLVARNALERMRRNGWVVQRSAIAMMNGIDLLDFRLGGLKQPTLIVWGAADRLTPVQEGARMHELIPQSQFLELPGCGHMVPVECGAQAIVPVKQFLSAGNRE